ncbi:unnamed protein product [Schistosoma mattheei]|uniref:PIK-related kinase FAT domain-containing protein n=1 Tax=Schistosoma mattheei TaxID=31246 RepID=A0A3P8D2U8_9TREM|nr:unnamed protein product [Schistosoma mattheei]
MLSYLVDRLERLGDGTNESALYMRLLKLCFSSVNMSGTENELVMKLHLRRIVQGSMHYCLTAKEPTAYFTLLRTLFRSIGGGAHDKLYREFFPLLPEMLTTLNRLLRSPHRSNARDLLGELCVIVPVRLSTLLPYLSLLMEPLVYVLNCNTVNQGLRTLELCVDNMQPDFLHDHLYQVLGKLGRFNRTNLLETQRLRISSAEGEAGPQLRFHMNEFRNQPIDIPIRCLVDAAVEVLQDSSSDEPSKLRSWEFLQSICVAALNLNHSQQSSDGVEDFYNCFLGDTGLNNMILQYIDDMYLTSYSENPPIQSIRPSCCMADDLCNHVMIMAIAGLLLAGLSKELYSAHGDFIAFIVRHATFLSIMQQFTSLHTEISRDHISHSSTSFESKTLCKVDTAPKLPFSNDITTSGNDHFLELEIFSISQDPDTITPTVKEPQSLNQEFLPNNSSSRLNPNIIIDSIMFVMGHEAKQLTRNMCIFLEIIHNTAFAILSAVTTTSRENSDHFTTETIKKAVANLQIFQHIGHIIVDMLYHPAWYVKWGACASILCLARFIHPSWFCSNLISLLRGLLYCIHSLSNQMNQGALMMARDCARIIISMVFISLKDSNETNHFLHSTVVEEEDVKSGKSTPISTRKRSSTTSQRRTVQVRRGRSAANATSESSNNEASTNVVVESMEIDNQVNEKEFTPKFSSSLTTLLDAVIVELLDSLLSETDSVRTEARCLLRLLSYTIEQPLCKLLAPHWYKRIGHVLPPKQPNRLLDLPISTQLAVLEANYFFGQSEKLKHPSKVSDSSKLFDFDIDNNDDGVGLLRYDLSKRDDCIFLSDVRSLLTQFELNNDFSASTNNSTTTNTIAAGSRAVNTSVKNNSSINSDQEKGTFNGTYSYSKFTPFNSRTVIPLSSNCMRLINLRVAACQVLSVTWYLDTQKARNLTALFKGMSCKNEYIHETAFSCLREFISKTSIDIELRHANMKQIVQNIRQNSIRCIHTVRQLAYCAQLFPSTLSERLCDAIYNLELCTLLLDLFHLIPLATSKYVSLLIESVVNAERLLNIEPTSPLRLPLTRFLSRYPAETCALLLTGSRWPYNSHANRIFLLAYYAFGVLFASGIFLTERCLSPIKYMANDSDGQLCLPQVGTILTFACPRHLAIRAVHTIHKISLNWLTVNNVSSNDISKNSSRIKSNQSNVVWETKYHPLVSSLLAYWQSNLFVRRQSNLTLITLTKDAIGHQGLLNDCTTNMFETNQSISSNISGRINIPTGSKSTIPVGTDNLPCDPASLISSGTSDHAHWDEPRLLLDCLLDCFKSHPDDFDLLFVITIGVTRLRYVADLYPLRCLLVQLISESDLTWHRQLFLHFITIVKNRLNFLNRSNSPEFSPIAFGMYNPISTEDMYKLLAHLILPCLSNALERGENEIFFDYDLVHLFTSVLLEDPAVQTCTELRVMYYQMASLFVYHTPNYVHMGSACEQSYRLLKFTEFARPCLTSSLTAVDLQEKYTGLQLLSHLIAKFNVLRTATIQVFQCLAKGAHTETKKIVNPALDILIPAWIRGPEDQTEPTNSPMDKPQRDQLVNLLIRFACQAIDASQSGSLSEQSVTRTLAQLEFALRSDVWGGETCELRLAFIDRYFSPDDSSSSHSMSSTPSGGVPANSLNTHGIHMSGTSNTTPTSTPSGPHANASSTSALGATQATSLLMTLEVLRVLFSTLESPTLLINVKHFSVGLCNVLTRQLTNVRLIRSCAGLIRAMLERYPAEASHRQKVTAYPELYDIYSTVLKAIQDSFTMFSENVSKATLLTRLQSAFLLFTSTQVQSNPHAFVDRCIVQLVKLVNRLIQDLVTPNCNSNAQESGTSAQLTDLLIMGLEMIKSRLNVVSHEMRKTIFGPDLCLIMDRARDPRLFCAVLQVLRDWINVPKSEEHFAPTAREKVNFFYRLWQAYPRWIDNSPDVAREILECVYDVYASTSVFKNHDLYMKLEQAFCCGLISPFPDINERFISLYLEASQIRYPTNSYSRRIDVNVTNCNNENIPLSSSTDPTDSYSDKEILSTDQSVSSNYSCASLLVLLCDVDTTAPPVLSINAQCFNNIFNYFSKLPSVSTNEISIDGLTHEQTTTQQSCDPLQINEFKVLVESQIKGLNELHKLSISSGLRGMLCLAHKRPALASNIFQQLWPQIWDRLLLQQSETFCSSSESKPAEHSETISSVQEHSNTLQTGFVHESLQTGCLESSILSDSPAANGHNLSPNEIRGFVIPQLIRFLTSDQHVHPAEPQPSSLGAFFNGLASCPDTLLIHLPLPAITYLAQAHNQWYTVVLFLESMCFQASKFNGQCILNDLIYSIDPPSNEQSDFILSNLKPHEFPFGAATLSLISLYNEMNDIDFLTFAWWYRISSHQRHQKTFVESMNDSVRSSSVLTCLEFAQHGYLLRSLDYAMDNLSGSQVLSTTNSLEVSSCVGSSASLNRAAAAAAASSSNSFPSSRPIILADPSLHLGELVNRARLRDYCVLQLKQLGQWESLDSLASSIQSANHMTSSFGSTSTSGGNPNTAAVVSSSNSGGSSYWGLKADAAWRRSDWSEVYYDLARLANECPRSELPRYALIQAAACVAGRRAPGLGAINNPSVDIIDSYNSSLNSNDISTGSTTTGPSSSVPNNTNPTNVTSTPPSNALHSNTGSVSPMNNIVNMIHASEQESHRVVIVTLMEWRRLPLIVTAQHIPLLQIAHRAVEITEGNSLLAQYCGHVLGGSTLASGVSNSSYSSPSQTSSGSSTPVPQTNSISTPSASSVNMRLPFNQALHDYKTVFKAWQSRPCSIGDDLGFWHDLYSWRQSNLIALCQRELALSQLQLARGARKCRFPSIAQQHLDRYTRMNLPPLFEKTKQEIKLKLTDLRKDELLEGLELMEKTNIQQFEKKDRAKFFCYKAVFFSHFNKGDEATKNFGYATQMQDNLHKVWSIYGDFLENVYSSYPSVKREVAVSTTGIFAMLALMEAASVSGDIERKSRGDIAKCLWLLTLDDVNGQQRLGHTFEARASRVRPEVFLPWLPDLVASLLRPEGRFIVSALRRVIIAYPTVLYGHLKGLQHQLATEVNNDQKLAEIIHNPESKDDPYIIAIQNRITSTLGSGKEAFIKCGNLSWSLNRGTGTFDINNSDGQTGYSYSSTHHPFSLSSTSCNTPKVGSHNNNNNNNNNSNTIYPNSCGVNSSISSNSNTLSNSKKKKRVIVVMRGVEGERLNTSPSCSPPPHPLTPTLKQQKPDFIGQSSSRSMNHPKKVVIRGSDHDSTIPPNSDHDQIDYLSEDAEMTELEEDTEITDADRDDEDEDFTGNEDIGLYETDSSTKNVINDLEPKVVLSDIDDDVVGSDPVTGAISTDLVEQTVDIGYGNSVTGCLSNSVVHGLHYANILINQLKRKHPARLYVVDLFTNEVGGRLRPSWSEQFLSQLCSVLDYLQRLAYAHLHPGRQWNFKNLQTQTIPLWLATELKIMAHDCGMPRNTFLSSHMTEHTTPLHSSIKFDSTSQCVMSTDSQNDEKEKSKSPQSKLTTRAFACTKPKTNLDIASERDDPKLSSEPQKQSVLSPNISAFHEVDRIASESLIEKLTRRWIPMVEQHVAKLPVRTHISSYGAKRLLELPNIVSPVSTPITPSSKSNVSNAPQPFSVFSSIPTFPCLELPGESGLLQSSAVNLSSMANSHHSQNESSQQIGGYINNIPLYLHVAEIMPHVERIRCSSGAFASPARRMGFRASNGRLFFYDLPCPSTPPIMDLAVMQIDALNGAKCHELLNAISINESTNLEHLTGKEFCPSAYISWRQSGPLQLFQMINSVLLGQPETAKRNLSLFVSRRMEVGPSGLYLTQFGSSVSAANVSIASACPLPSANPVNNRRLTALARPPPVGPSFPSTSVDENPPNHVSSSTSFCEEACKKYSWSLSFVESHLTPQNIDKNQLSSQGILESLKARIRIPSPPPGPLPNLMTVQPTSLVNQSTVVGSAAMASEAIGRPAGLDAGCRCVCNTVLGILEKSNCTLLFNSNYKQKYKFDDLLQSMKLEHQQEVKMKTKSSSSDRIQSLMNSSVLKNSPTGYRNLICLFYEYISKLSNQNEITNHDLFKIFLDLSSRIPQAPNIRDPVFSNLGTFGNDDDDLDNQKITLESLKNQLEFPRGKLLQNWAKNQMLDSESYWLLRRSLAHNLGTYGLIERLFHLTPLHPGCLVIDPRSGHTEAHHVCFGLPGDNSSSEQSHLLSSEKGFNQSYFISCFNQSMLIQKLEKSG